MQPAKYLSILKRYFYKTEIAKLRETMPEEVIGHLASSNEFNLETTQRDAWLKEIEVLNQELVGYEGVVLFEFSIPRMGKRVDAVLIIEKVVFVLEFKVGERKYNHQDIDQVWDYGLDLKNFHKSSHHAILLPVLIATEAPNADWSLKQTIHMDGLYLPVCSNGSNLCEIIRRTIESTRKEADLAQIAWEQGVYAPTPTIIEAARALYSNHSVEEITRADASATNLKDTSQAIIGIIEWARSKSKKAICFVTGVPGAGKTLVGLDVATKQMDKMKSESSVFLSGNGPLVAILREALTRDGVDREKMKGIKVRKGDVGSKVKAFIQNVHHFRDEYLRDSINPPADHVAIFDEAQRAWDLQQTATFMARKKGVSNFSMSEPEFLISCLDRHPDWAVIVCLIGGGQEINTGEAGIKEWFESINRRFGHWKVFVSNNIHQTEYDSEGAIGRIEPKQIEHREELHLSVSQRSFRAEKLSSFVKTVLDLEVESAKLDFEEIRKKYPIALTRNLETAKEWLRAQARGSERYGIVVSSQASRLKPYAIDVKSPMDPIHWFLDGKEDIRSSYFCEDVATEFHVQGLELDWVCVAWDADFRYTPDGWQTYSFIGSKWNNIHKAERKKYLKNAYRVLLTRARQGMVIYVPLGTSKDLTRLPSFYNPTFEYLSNLGLHFID